MIKKRILKNPTNFKGSFAVNKDLFIVFKCACKFNNSDASKELRKFVEKYVNECEELNKNKSYRFNEMN